MLRGPGIRRTIVLILEICLWHQTAFKHVKNFNADSCLCYKITSNSGMVTDSPKNENCWFRIKNLAVLLENRRKHVA